MRSEDFKIDPQANLSIQYKARGLLHMECEYFAHNIKCRFRGFEHLTASKQPRVLGDLLEAFDGRPRSTPRDVHSTQSIQRCLPKYSMPEVLGYEEVGGLSDLGQRDCS